MSESLRWVLAVLVVLALPCPASADEWSFALSGFVFDPPDDSPYFSPIFYADRGALHLEARYNYEDL